MKIWVKIVYGCIKLPKKLPHPLRNPGYAPAHAPPFENFSLDALSSKQKTFCKITGRLGRSETGRAAGQPA